MSEHPCKSCDAPATVAFTWNTSQGVQECGFCQFHADDWWKKYAHTPAGESLQIVGIDEPA